MGKMRSCTAVLASTHLGVSRAGAIGPGISALILQDQNYRALRVTIDADRATLEKPVAHLEESLSSLPEVVLQNRRGHDLLFLHQGGLCMVLGK